MSNYISPEEATRIRVFRVSESMWHIDAIDDDENYTEVCWDSYWERTSNGRRWHTIPNLATALKLVPTFAKENVPHLTGTNPFVGWDDLASRTLDQEVLL